MSNLNPYAAAFGGATGGWNPYAASNPFTHQPAGGYDRNLFEENEGRPALSFYATQVGAQGPYKDWLEKATTQHAAYTDYMGQVAARNDPTFAFTDYLAQNDPYKRYMQMSQQDRGEAPVSAFSPFLSLMNLG